MHTTNATIYTLRELYMMDTVERITSSIVTDSTLKEKLESSNDLPYSNEI